MAFIDMGDQFIALSRGRTQPPDLHRHFGLVVDDKEAVREALVEAGVPRACAARARRPRPVGQPAPDRRLPRRPVHEGSRDPATPWASISRRARRPSQSFAPRAFSASRPSSAGFSRTAPAPCAPPSEAARPCGSRAPGSRAGACSSCPSAPGTACRRSAPAGSRSPARRSCAQSENLHSAASSLISENVVSRISSSAQSCSSRIPGVSRRTAPEGSGTSSRCDVVCRPRPPALVCGGGEHVPAGEAVHERRLADARRAEQGDRLPRLQVRVERRRDRRR